MLDSQDSLHRLTQGIKSMISKHYSSFTDAEISLLNECVDEIQKQIDQPEKYDLDAFVKVIDLLSKVFGLFQVFDNLK